MPPEAIADVLGAVLKLLGVRDVSWLSMKKFLRSRGVKGSWLPPSFIPSFICSFARSLGCVG
tara:strand:+ start:683 stop:868 length:186 start_codon:yes stop_codon:yes gene_type:complete